MTAKKFQSFYKDMDGISIPQPFCGGFVPFAWLINKGLDMHSWYREGRDRRRRHEEGSPGLLGEPLFLGVVVGIGIGCLTCNSWAEIVDKIPYILGLGIKMGAVMELIPRVTVRLSGSQAYQRRHPQPYRPQIQGRRRPEYRYEPRACHRPSDHTRGVAPSHPRDPAPRRRASGQPVPPARVACRVCSMCFPSCFPSPRAMWSRP